MASSVTGVTVDARVTSLGFEFIQQHAYPTGSTVPVPRSPDRQIHKECANSQDAVQYMSRINARIIFFLSMSNWHVVFGRINSKLNFLATSGDYQSDYFELRLLEWCNVDQARLCQVLQAVSNSFMNLKRPAQVAIATSLRKAIWNWIEVHPAEFHALVESNRNIDRSAERLFDVLYSASDSSSHFSQRAYSLYPLMTMLLVICPETTKRVAMKSISGKFLGSSGKKSTFVDTFRRGITNSKTFEHCAVCHIDFIRASGYVSPDLSESGLRTLGPDLHVDLRVSPTALQ